MSALLIAASYEETTGLWTVEARAAADDDSAVLVGDNVHELLSIAADVATGG